MMIKQIQQKNEESLLPDRDVLPMKQYSLHLPAVSLKHTILRRAQEIKLSLVQSQ